MSAEHVRNKSSANPAQLKVREAVRLVPLSRNKSEQLEQVSPARTWSTCSALIEGRNMDQVVATGPGIGAGKSAVDPVELAESRVDLDPVGAALQVLAFFVPGAAAPEPRPRFDRVHGRAYVPSNADEWKHQVRASAVEARLSRPSPVPLPTAGALRVRLVFWRRRPKAHTTKAGELRAAAPRHATSRPDLDNTTKAALDALGTWNDLPPLVWFDDAQVVEQHEVKAWCTPEQPREGLAVVLELLP